MADLPTTPAAASELPDIFTPMHQLLLLLSIGNRALFSRSTDPLPMALTELTGFDMASVDQVAAITDSAGLYTLLRETPETFADYLLLGQLTFASPLGASLTSRLAPDDSAEPAEVAERRAELLTYVARAGAWQSEVIEKYLLSRYEEEDQAEAAEERADLRAALAAAFAEWEHSLGALALDAPAPVVALEGTGWSIRPLQIQLDTLHMALTVLRSLPELSSHPFAKAVQHLPDFHPQRLEELGDHLKEAEAEEPLALTRAQGMLLYIAAHVGTLLFVNDLLDGEGLDDLLLRRHADDEDLTAEMVDQLRHATTVMLSAYIDLIREHEGEAEDFQALEARLAPVLALGAE